MKIALVAPIEETIPPHKYGGTEWIIYHLANGLGEKGHEVDLYAAGNSTTKKTYNIVSIHDNNIRSDDAIYSNVKLKESCKLLSAEKAANLIIKGHYDIIHNHASWRFLLFSHFIKSPLINTHHFIFSRDYEKKVFLAHKDALFTSISNRQQTDLPKLNFLATVYNGVNVQDYSFSKLNSTSDDYLLFLARLEDSKGAIEAAKVAHKLKRKLIIAAKIDPQYESYYSQLKPYIDNKLVFLKGEIGFEEKVSLIKNAKVLIAPIKWEEPFGLMFIEAMSCGTPVISFARGAAPEIVLDGSTGYLVNQSDELSRGEFIIKKTYTDGLTQAIDKIYSLPSVDYQKMRNECRSHVENHFTVKKMVEGYEDVYKKLINNR